MVSWRVRLLVNAGLAEHAQHRTHEGIGLLLQALDIVRAEQDEEAAVLVMVDLGAMFFEIGEFGKAIVALEGALPTLRNRGDRLGEQRALLSLCGAQSALYHHAEAVNNGRRAVELGDVVGIAPAHNQLGNAARRAGLMIEALENYQAAATHYREHGPAAGLADTLNNIGGLQHNLGKLPEAAESLEEALTLHRAANDVGGQVSALNTLGWVLRDLGRPAEALVRLTAASRLARQSGDPELIGATAQRVGGVYVALGRFDEAIEEYQAADREARALDRPWAMGAAANSLGRALLAAGDAAGAAQQLERAADLAKRIAVPTAEAVAQTGVAIALLQAGDVDGAGGAALAAMRLSVGVGDLHTQAVAVAVAGQIAMAAGNLPQAQAFLEDAGTRFAELDSEVGVAVTLADLGDVYRELGHAGAAVTAFEQAMTSVESVRRRIQDDDTRASFFSSFTEVPSRYCALLVSLGRAAEALHVAERARARVLAERMARLRLDTPITKRHMEIQDELFAIEQQLATLVRTHEANPAEVTATRDRRRALKLDLLTTAAELQSADQRLADLVSPRAPDLATLRREVIGDAVLLEYVLGKSGSVMIAVTKNREQAYKLPPRAEIERMVLELRLAVLSRQPVYPHGHELFRILVAPAAELIAGRDMVVVPDGVLHDLPFALLLTKPVKDWSLDKLPYLVRDHAVSVLPSATVASLIDSTTGMCFERELVAFGDPATPDQSRLGYAAREILGIAQLVDPTVSSTDRYDSVKVRIRTGATATKEEFRGLADGPDGLSCRFLHFATHGVLDAERPEFSGLLFSDDEVLCGYEIMGWRMRTALVVLSACETGLGRVLSGEGVLGLSRSFLYAGTSTVAVSLWRVVDASTSRLMKRMYQEMLGDGSSPAAALRAAQRAMIDSKMAHPYYWAAFVLVGLPYGAKA